MAISDVFQRALGVGRHHMHSFASAKRQFANTAAAQTEFTERRRLLLDVNQWSRISGIENANFALFDAEGHRVYRHHALEGDFIAIDLPVAGLVRTDWVRIERIDLEPSLVSVTVRPSHDPTRKPVKPGIVAHFFTSEATNTFTLERRGPWMFARVEGRNECANTADECESPQLAAANRVLAESGWGAPVGIPGTNFVVKGVQQHQWDRFTANLVGK